MVTVQVDNSDAQRIQLLNGINSLEALITPELVMFAKAIHQNKDAAMAHLQENDLLRRTLKMGLDLEKYLDRVRGGDLS